VVLCCTILCMLSYGIHTLSAATSVNGPVLAFLRLPSLSPLSPFHTQVRDMVGNNPIVLVGTKMDLLPPGCSPKEVADWLTEAAGRRRLQVWARVWHGCVTACVLDWNAHRAHVSYALLTLWCIKLQGLR
jgi:hypothetical protein